MSRNTGKSIKQAETVKQIKKVFNELYPEARFIKMHGSKYQERGLPDIMILTWSENYWLEMKNAHDDYPSAIQKYNLINLKTHGFITGIVVGNEIKIDLSGKFTDLFSTVKSLKNSKLKELIKEKKMKKNDFFLYFLIFVPYICIR